MSLLGTNPNSFEPTCTAAIASSGFRRPRPILKRSRTPYNPASERKRRRTSPTGAFSRLSISPNSKSSPPLALSELGPSPCPATSESKSLSPAPATTEMRMRSVYSAYEIEPDRIFIESLSDGPSSPTDDEQQKARFELDQQLSDQIHAHQQTLALSPNHTLFSPSALPTPENQLVLYRKPAWPIIPSNYSEHSQTLPLAFDGPQLIEIQEADEGQVIEIDEPENIHQPDSMEID